MGSIIFLLAVDSILTLKLNLEYDVGTRDFEMYYRTSNRPYA